MNDTTWNTTKDIFDSISNAGIEYVVLRNYESIGDNEILISGHGDIDLLCDNYKKVVKILDAKRIYRFPNRNSFLIKFQNVDVQVDIRFIGDGYYDTKWEEQLLRTRILYKETCYVVNQEMYFYSLIYHAIFQKDSLSKEYFLRLCSMAKLQNLVVKDEQHLKELLFDYMIKNGYQFTFTKDPAVVLNFSEVNKKMIKKDNLRILQRMLFNYCRRAYD